MTIMQHNLPACPYRKFFGREESVEKISNTLLCGGTFIASIDGVGGIGKTALAYHFCESVLLPSGEFDYLVWLTSKKVVFDPFSRDSMMKPIDNDFYGVETLVDTTLQVVGLEEAIGYDPELKQSLFEDILSN